jgi:lipopolysaccharide export system protein LptA
MKRTFSAAMLLLAICIVLPLSLNAQIVIPAKKEWTKTAITVANGDQVVVTATGTITLDPNVTTDANGMKIVSGPENVLIKGNRGGLIARVGKKSVPFFVGANGKFIVAGAGLLYFGINDNKVKNNSGEYTLTVTVNGKAQ